MDQAEYDAIRVAARARIAEREAAEAIDFSAWADGYEASVNREGGPAKFFGECLPISIDDAVEQVENASEI